MTAFPLSFYFMSKRSKKRGKIMQLDGYLEVETCFTHLGKPSKHKKISTPTNVVRIKVKTASFA